MNSYMIVAQTLERLLTSPAVPINKAAEEIVEAVEPVITEKVLRKLWKEFARRDHTYAGTASEIFTMSRDLFGIDLTGIGEELREELGIPEPSDE